MYCRCERWASLVVNGTETGHRRDAASESRSQDAGRAQCTPVDPGCQSASSPVCTSARSTRGTSPQGTGAYWASSVVAGKVTLTCGNADLSLMAADGCPWSLPDFLRTNCGLAMSIAPKPVSADAATHASLPDKRW